MKSYEEKIYDAIARFGILFDNVPSSERIQAYVEHLKKYSPEKLSEALSELKVECHKFPSLATIVKKIDPPMSDDDKANEIAGAILDAIPRFGYTHPELAKKHLGAVAWWVVERTGGWQSLCEMGTGELGTWRAQLRDIAKAATKISKREDSEKLLPHERSGMQSFKELASELENKKMLT